MWFIQWHSDSGLDRNRPGFYPQELTCGKCGEIDNKFINSEVDHVISKSDNILKKNKQGKEIENE